MTITHGQPSIRAAFTAIALAVAGAAYPGLAGAATFFQSHASVTSTVSLGGGASWSNLGFAAGYNDLDASAQVATPGDESYLVSAVNQTVNREVTPPTPYDQVNLSGGIAPLLFLDESGSLNYPVAAASSSMGTARASATPSGSGYSFTMTSNITGTAYESKGYASAGVDWLTTTFFKNLSADPLTVIWTVAYNLADQAHADHPPQDVAIVESKLFAGIGSGLPCCNPEDALDFGVAGDPPIDPPESMVPVRPNPPAVAGQKQYQITLAPGATEQFSVYITHFGFAQVAHVPEPDAMWLVSAGLGMLPLFTRRRASSAARRQGQNA